MPLPRLLVVVLLSFSALNIALAEDLPKPQDFFVSVPKPDADTMTSEQKDQAYTAVLDRLHNWRDGMLRSETICYTMRTYVTDRKFDKEFVLKPGTPEDVSFTPPVHNGSQVDSPLTGNYTTCQPSSQFAVKKAIQLVESAKDGK
jgi:hypothetical protein